MPQIKKSFTEIRIPFAKMSFTPDIPSSMLTPNEYNVGNNVETDVRGIRSVAGDQEILRLEIPGTPTFVTGGFRSDDRFWTIAATDEGYWWASSGGPWYDITPVGGPFTTYDQATNITQAWNGTVPFFNDEANPPMFWPEAVNATRLTVIDATGDGASATLTFLTQPSAPFSIGQEIVVEAVIPIGYRGVYTVTNCTTSTVEYSSTETGSLTREGLVGDTYPVMTMYSNIVPNTIANIVTVDPTTQRIEVDTPYATAPFVAGESVLLSDINRFFNSSDVGSYLVVASTTTTIDIVASPAAVYPGGSVGTVSAAYTWNFNPNWKSVYAKFMRLYNTPNVGSILVAGNLVATDLSDQEEVFPVTVQWSQAFGLNTAPQTWEPTVLNVANQLEVPLRGEAVDAFPCNGNFFICSYWDTVVFSPINFSTTNTPILGVRLFNQGRGLLTSNCWANTDDRVYGIDARDIWMFNGNTFVGIGNQRVKNWFYDQLDQVYVDRVFMCVNTQRNQVEIYYPTVDAVNGVPNKMLSYRYDLDCWNAPRDVAGATSAAETPVRFYNNITQSWRYDRASRTVMYARGEADQLLIQMHEGFEFVPTVANPTGTINSVFRRDNIQLIPDYSGKIMVHRLLPEIYNLNTNEIVVNPQVNPLLTGTVDITVEGANSVGQTPQSVTAQALATNTDNPWIQVNNNAHRVNSLIIGNSSTETIWSCTAATVQFTQTEDDR